MDTLLQDLRYGFRMMLRRPGFAAIAILTLAIGIGACTAIFSIVDAVLLRSLPYSEPDRILQLREVTRKGSRVAVAEPNFLDIRAQNHSLETLALYSSGLTTVTGGAVPVRVNVAVVSGDLFRVFDVLPSVGRVFTEEESKAGGGTVAVVSYGFWQRLLGGNADVTSSALNIDNRSMTVIGVMPPGFDFPEKTEVWIPRNVYPPNTSRTAHNWRVIARLRPDVSLKAARSELNALAGSLKQQYGEEIDMIGVSLIPLQEFMVGDIRSGLLLIFGAVAFLLLIACANVANLLLARAASRQKELAVRAALGATRFRLARQFIAESWVLALIGGALGVLISFWGLDLLIALNQENLPRANEIHVDARALVFTLILSFFVAVVLGVISAMRASGYDLQRALKEGGRDQSSIASNRLRGIFVVSEFALTLVLLIAAGLLGKSFLSLLSIDPGFRPEGAVVMDVSLPFPEDEQQQQQLVAFHNQLLEKLENLPGVVAVGGINDLPMAVDGADGTFLIDNDRTKSGYGDFRVTSPGYFAAMGIPLLHGRVFDSSDTANSPHAAVISQSLAELYFPQEDAIGRQIQFGNMDGDPRLLNIIGVVGDVRDRGLDTRVSPTVYTYYLQRPRKASDFSIIARTKTDPAALISSMRREVESLNGNVPSSFRTLEQVFSSSLDERRFSLVVFGVFAAAALALAIAGIYGVMSYSVTERTREIGVRMALGAQPGDVLKLVIRQGMKQAVIGVAIGLTASIILTRLIESMLFGVSATDPLTFVLLTSLLIVIALAACYVPARRATKIDPMVALRYE